MDFYAGMCRDAGMSVAQTDGPRGIISDRVFTGGIILGYNPWMGYLRKETWDGNGKKVWKRE